MAGGGGAADRSMAGLTIATENECTAMAISIEYYERKRRGSGRAQVEVAVKPVRSLREHAAHARQGQPAPCERHHVKNPQRHRRDRET